MIISIAISSVILGVDGSLSEAKNISAKGAVSTFPYHYSSNDRRDPFRPILEQVQPTVGQESVKSSSQLTESRWNLLGIMAGVSGRQAVIQFGKGKRYVVSHGDVLSAENVRVIRLTNAAVTLELLEGTDTRNKSSKPQSLELSFMR